MSEQFAAEIFHQAGLQPALVPTSSVEFGAEAVRPAYSVLAYGRLQASGGKEMRTLQQAVTTHPREIRAEAAPPGVRTSDG